MADHININGKIISRAQAGLAPDNSAFRYGYGLFETVLVRDGQAQLWPYHLERLEQGMNLLGLRLPAHQQPATLEQELLRAVKKNGQEKLCRVRLQVYGGSGGIFEPRLADAGYLVECYELEEGITRLNNNGLVAGIATGIAKSADVLANLKSSNALVYTMAARQARDRKWNDALVTNTSGHIIESCIANIFWVQGGTLYTPPLTEGCVAGVMRRHIMSRHTVTEQPLTTGELMAADEVWLTNAIRGIKWVGRIGDKEFGHSLAEQVAAQLAH